VANTLPPSIGKYTPCIKQYMVCPIIVVASYANCPSNDDPLFEEASDHKRRLHQTCFCLAGRDDSKFSDAAS